MDTPTITTSTVSLDRRQSQQHEERFHRALLKERLKMEKNRPKRDVNDFNQVVASDLAAAEQEYWKTIVDQQQQHDSDSDKGLSWNEVLLADMSAVSEHSLLDTVIETPTIAVGAVSVDRLQNQERQQVLSHYGLLTEPLQKKQPQQEEIGLKGDVQDHHQVLASDLAAAAPELWKSIVDHSQEDSDSDTALSWNEILMADLSVAPEYSALDEIVSTPTAASSLSVEGQSQQRQELFHRALLKERLRQQQEHRRKVDSVTLIVNENTAPVVGSITTSNNKKNDSFQRALLEARLKMEQKTITTEKMLVRSPTSPIRNGPTTMALDLTTVTKNENKPTKVISQYWKSISTAEVASSIIDSLTPERDIMQLLDENNDVEILGNVVSNLVHTFFDGGKAAISATGEILSKSSSDKEEDAATKKIRVLEIVSQTAAKSTKQTVSAFAGLTALALRNSDRARNHIEKIRVEREKK